MSFNTFEHGPTGGICSSLSMPSLLSRTIEEYWLLLQAYVGQHRRRPGDSHLRDAQLLLFVSLSRLNVESRRRSR